MCSLEHWRAALGSALETQGAGLPNGSIGESVREKPFLIGVAWQGNPARRLDHWRSFPLAQLAGLARLPGVCLVSVQVQHGLDQLAGCAPSFPVIDVLGTRDRDFVETAALLTQLDLVITPDTAVAHLAGGLGVPVWVALCALGDWRYPHGRNDTPWYPTMRLFRQSRLGEWNDVFAEMTSVLEDLLDKNSTSSSGGLG